MNEIKTPYERGFEQGAIVGRRDSQERKTRLLTEPYSDFSRGFNEGHKSVFKIEPLIQNWHELPNNKFKREIDRRGYSIEKLCESLGYSRNYMNRFLNGSEPLNMPAAGRLAKLFGTTSQYWLAFWEVR